MWEIVGRQMVANAQWVDGDDFGGRKQAEISGYVRLKIENSCSGIVKGTAKQEDDILASSVERRFLRE
jgi:hypothetical protein